MKKFFAWFLSAALCVSLCACSAPTSETSAANAETSKSEDLSNTLVYAGESESTINPLLNNHEELPDLIFSGLMKYDANGQPVPDLAESYDFDESTLTLSLIHIFPRKRFFSGIRARGCKTV